MKSPQRMLAIALALLAAAGCQTPATTPGGAALPFNGATASDAPSAAAGGVQQASFEEAQTSPGVSIAGEYDKQYDEFADKTFEEKVSDAFRPLAPQQMWLGMKRSVGLGPDEVLARQRFDQGVEAFRTERYADAASEFGWAAFRWPDSVLEEDALLMQAESYFFANQYSKASDIYTRLLSKYENSRHLERVVARQFAIGQYWDELGRQVAPWGINVTDRTRPIFDTTGHAVANYKAVWINDPLGPLADDATMAAANNYFLRKRYEEAAYHYEQLRENYPQSDHQVAAHLLGLQSRLRTYQGPQYDGQPLVEAEKIGNQAVTQFSTELGEEQQRVSETLDQISALQAEREWAFAEYYYKNRYYRAAGHYYRTLAEKFPNTQLGQLARDRLTEIESLPPEPPDRFAWLSNLLGEAQVR